MRLLPFEGSVGDLSMQCCAASSGALAAINSDTVVLVLVLPAAAPVSVSDVRAVLQGGAAGSVTDVQPFPGQSSSYLIEVKALPMSSGTLCVVCLAHDFGSLTGLVSGSQYTSSGSL